MYLIHTLAVTNTRDTLQTSLQKKLKNGTQATLEVAQGGIVKGYCYFLGALV
jgi:hypothetical protein